MKHKTKVWSNYERNMKQKIKETKKNFQIHINTNMTHYIKRYTCTSIFYCFAYSLWNLYITYSIWVGFCLRHVADFTHYPHILLEMQKKLITTKITFFYFVDIFYLPVSSKSFMIKKCIYTQKSVHFHLSKFTWVNDYFTTVECTSPRRENIYICILWYLSTSLASHCSILSFEQKIF